MPNLEILDIGKLLPKELEIEKLYLDPNNPRFMGVESTNYTSTSKITNQKVQRRALENMKQYSLKELKENIEEVGFLPIDKMVFSQINGQPNEYYCLEGNRRLAAIKWILEDYEAGETEVKDDIINNLKKIDVYVLESNSPEEAQEIIQGIRHMSGVKDWRPYQKAKVVARLISEGKSASDVAKMFGTNTQTVLRFYRTFKACEEFKNDENFGNFWNVEMYRTFEDVIRRPRLRNEWLGWDESNLKFMNINEVEFFYKWIVPDPDTKEKKIPGANYIKDLDSIVSYPEALDYLKNDGASLASALALTKQRTSKRWTTAVRDAQQMLESIEAKELEDLNKEEETLLKNLQKSIEKTLNRANKLRR